MINVIIQLILYLLFILKVMFETLYKYLTGLNIRTLTKLGFT